MLTKKEKILKRKSKDKKNKEQNSNKKCQVKMAEEYKKLMNQVNLY